MHTGPHNVLGIEINEFAAELARVTVWIGDIQWCRRNGYAHATNPILQPLDGIEHRDALLNPDGSEAEWPEADVVVGNPPFLGGSVMRSELGDAYVETLRQTYEGRVPGGADLVTYWFEKARAQMAAAKLKGAGLVATNSIRGGANRKVLERICESMRIFEAWSDEPWVNEGAAVRVSLIGFGHLFGVDRNSRLDGAEVAAIHADLTAGEGINLTQAKRLSENAAVCFEGIKKYGPFNIPGDTARAWLASAGNPNGRSNADVLHPWINATDVVRNDSDTWVIDFTGLSVNDAALYEAPFQFALENVQPARAQDRNAKTREQWWLYERPRLEMRKALASLPRFIVTPVVAKHRIFAWRSTPTLAMNLLDVIARSDDTTFGILHSRFHELWSLGLCTWLGVGNDPRYTPTTTFETFPFPAGLTPRDTAPKAGHGSPPCMAGDILGENIAAAARRLNELREAWLNPPEWVDWVITPEEEAAGFPRRPVAKPGHEADLRKRTLTNLYNARPAWLALAHQALDQAVAAAYGWTDYTPEMPDDEILRRLLALNLERSQ
jgi:type II restriction/modification system DNA methylase subunit YeeA